jgi:transposase
VLPGLPPSAGSKVRPAGHPSGSPRRPQPSLRRPRCSRQHHAVIPSPYSPELNPKENLWDEIREKIFKNYALKSIDAVRTKLKQAILCIERNPKLVQPITSFPYIVNSL